MEAVIIGVSFVGAGTIIRSRNSGDVEGLTTAASLLVAAGVGVCVVLSQIMLAVGVTILVLTTLRGLGYIERRMVSRKENP
jgi:putative Mg2+ transporter-C (MgtC) family protein